MIDKINYISDYLSDELTLNTTGYLCSDNYYTDGNFSLKNIGIYCWEVNIINKIKYNLEGYFDFTKSMIDIGCEFGTYSFILPFNYSYMFDGNNEKLILAQCNMLIHQKSNKFKSYNILLNDKKETIKYDGFSTEYCPWVENFKQQNTSVETYLLDEFNLDNIGFIKIDVEGMEENVLRGAIGTIIRNNYPPILFELWDVNTNGMTQERHDSLQKFLEKLGYKILWKWGDFETHLAIHK